LLVRLKAISLAYYRIIINNCDFFQANIKGYLKMINLDLLFSVGSSTNCLKFFNIFISRCLKTSQDLREYYVRSQRCIIIIIIIIVVVVVVVVVSQSCRQTATVAEVIDGAAP
jgi:hypothetical protein